MGECLNLTDDLIFHPPEKLVSLGAAPVVDHCNGPAQKYLQISERKTTLSSNLGLVHLSLDLTSLPDFCGHFAAGTILGSRDSPSPGRWPEGHSIIPLLLSLFFPQPYFCWTIG